MTIVYLLCVGESTWTRFHRLEGTRDISLSEKGRSQTLIAAQELQQFPITKIYYARTTRGTQSAKIIHEYWTKNDPLVRQLQKTQRVKSGKSTRGFERGKYFSLTKRNQFATVELVRESRLNDLHYGQLQGLYPEEIQSRYESIYRMWEENSLHTVFPLGDNVLERSNQLKDFLRSLHTHELYPTHYLVITHEPIIQMITSSINNLPLHQFRQISCTPGTFSVVQLA